MKKSWVKIEGAAQISVKVILFSKLQKVFTMEILGKRGFLAGKLGIYYIPELIKSIFW